LGFKALLLDLPLVSLLGAVRQSIPVYGSGGFTSYSIEQLRSQFRAWVESGFDQVKMKIGRNPEADVKRVRAAPEAIGPQAKLFVDANGAYSRKQALVKAEAFADLGVGWFEEPVLSDDLEGLRLLRDRAPASVDRNVIVVFLEPEGARHAAAARIQAMPLHRSWS
jgi:L-alanine-DL-glutamate epimerase-like enolase superfamily enzyme